MLNDTTLKTLKPGRTLKRVRDRTKNEKQGHADLKGFGVQITPSGARSFYLGYTSPTTGKRRFLKLGSYPGVSLSTARGQARKARAQIQQGIDPIEQREHEKALKREQDAKQKSLGTMFDLCNLYVDYLRHRGRRSADEVERTFRRDVLPRIGKMKAKDVTPDDITGILTDFSERGARVAGDHARSYLRSAFTFAMKARLHPDWRNKAPDFALTTNPVLATWTMLDETPVGTRALTAEEIKAIYDAGPEALSINAKLATLLLLATGQRVEEVLGATWDEFDTEAMVWSIPADRRKNGKPHLVPLAPLTLELLQEIQAYNGSKGWLFPSPRREGPINHDAVWRATKKFSGVTGVDRFSPRDCRRSWKTLTGALGLSLEIRNRIQGHGFSDVGSVHYDKYEYLTEKRAAMERWCRWLAGVLSRSDQGNVVELQRVSAQIRVCAG